MSIKSCKKCLFVKYTVSDSDTQKTSTEKLFDLRIYHTYYIDFFQIREAILKKSMHIILECSKRISIPHLKKHTFL